MENIQQQFEFSERVKILRLLGPNPQKDDLRRISRQYKIPEEKLEKWIYNYERYIPTQIENEDETIQKLIQEQKKLTQELSTLIEQINEQYKKKMIYNM